MKKFMIACLALSIVSSVVRAEYSGVIALDPPGASSCVAIEIATPQQSALGGLRWFNNDESFPFPKLVLVEGQAGHAPDLSNPGLILLEIEGESLAWGDVDFGGPITSSTGIVHAVFYYPDGVPTDYAGSGGGPGLGVREAENGAPFYISGDGENWARFDPAYELGVEPIPVLLRGGARVLSEMGGEVLLVGGGDDTAPAPVRTMLDRPFPNPFNPRVELTYALAKDSEVVLQVFDVSGRLVDTLVSEDQSVGRYTQVWNGTDHAGSAVASGVYFARFVAGDVRASHRMVLVR